MKNKIKKVLIIIAIISLISLSGCDTKIEQSERIPIEEKSLVNFQKIYYNCSDIIISQLTTEIIENSTNVDEIGLRNIVYFVDKELLVKISKEQNETIVCGRNNIKHYVHDRIYYDEGRIFEGTTSNCALGEIDYDDYETIESYCYNIICCINSGYCYKDVRVDKWDNIDYYYYEFCDNHLLGCYVKTIKCGDEERK